MSPEKYFSERALLTDIERKSADQHDKAILQLGLAALGVSIAFLDKIAPHPERWTLGILFGAWVAFVLSLMLVLASFYVSQMACRRQRELLDDEQRTQVIPPQQNKYTKYTIQCTLCAYATFVVGVFLLLSFSGVNLFAANDQVSPAAIREDKPDKENHNGKSSTTSSATTVSPARTWRSATESTSDADPEVPTETLKGDPMSNADNENLPVEPRKQEKKGGAAPPGRPATPS